jgi:hypothetical protein
MTKKNSGKNDLPDESGEQSHVDGNSGMDNLLDGERVPDTPEDISAEDAEEVRRHGKNPTKRISDIF